MAVTLDGDVLLRLEYRARGVLAFGQVWFPLALETSETADGDDWTTLRKLPGWSRAASTSEGTLIVDSSGAEFQVRRDGGWREVAAVLPQSTMRARVRVQPRDSTVSEQALGLRRIASERPIYPAAEYETRVRLVYLDGGDLARRKLWRGVRIEQVGTCRIRHAYRDGEGAEFATEYATVEGDATGRSFLPVGPAVPELAPELLARGGQSWELDALAYEVSPLASWT